MSSRFPRLERVLIAASLGLALAIVIGLLTEKSPSAAINRGDFPAFYTLARISSGDEPRRLYDLKLQTEVQNEAWPALNGSVLPAAYPAYVAFLVRPLAYLNPDTARLVWVTFTMVCAVVGVLALARRVPALAGMGWQLVVGAFLFAPFFMGVIGGQIVGVSVLCYALLVALSYRRGFGSDVSSGIVAGLWMVKPHYGLAAVAVLLFERRWKACVSWLVVTTILWTLGARVAGVNWVAEWLAFARHFSEVDLATNASQMSGVVPLVYSLTAMFGVGPSSSSFSWQILTAGAAFVVPLGLFIAVRCGRSRDTRVSIGLLVLGPLLILFAPMVNFYDLSLGLVPLMALFRPRERGDLIAAASLVAMGQFVASFKDTGVPGVSFVVAAVILTFASRAISRAISREVAKPSQT